MAVDDALARFGIRWTQAEARLSGFVAIVVQPDVATIQASYQLAAEVMPAAAEQTLAPGSLPHVTLTQCPIRDAPRDRLAEYVARLDRRLRGLTIPLRVIIPVGGGFLFWCVDEGSPRARSCRTRTRTR